MRRDIRLFGSSWLSVDVDKIEKYFKQLKYLFFLVMGIFAFQLSANNLCAVTLEEMKIVVEFANIYGKVLRVEEACGLENNDNYIDMIIKSCSFSKAQRSRIIEELNTSYNAASKSFRYNKCTSLAKKFLRLDSLDLEYYIKKISCAPEIKIKVYENK